MLTGHDTDSDTTIADTEFGKVKNMFNIGDECETERPDQYARGKVSQHGTEAEPATDWHADHGSAEVYEGFGEQGHSGRLRDGFAAQSSRNGR